MDNDTYAVEESFQPPLDAPNNVEDGGQSFNPSLEAEEQAQQHTSSDEQQEADQSPKAQSLRDFHAQLENKPRKKKNVNPYQKRLDQYYYENGTLQQTNQFLAQQNQDLLNELQQMRQDLSEKEKYNNHYFEDSLATKQQSIESELRRAKEEGDIERDISLTKQLAQVEATRMSHEVWKANQKNKQYERQQAQEYVPYEVPLQQPVQQASSMDPEYEEWVSENPWFENNESLRNEALGIADELAKHLSFNNQQHLIGTSGFRDTVTNMMKERYGAPAEQKQEQQVQEDPYAEYSSGEVYNPMSTQRTSRTPVAPVNQRAPSNSQHYVNPTPNRGMQPITKEEMLMARYLPNPGNLTEVDFIKKYQKAKNYPKSPLPNGSPDRLTII